MSIVWYFGFFFLSGFCSLVYEIVWLRLAMAKFGVTTPMVSIVLSVFMAGLALGSWGGGALARRLERFGPMAPLRLYGLIELLIGVSGLLVPRLINLGYELLQGGGGELTWNSSLYYLASGSCVILALLPWCTCMGATFPLGMAAIRRTVVSRSQDSFSYLYLSNVLGAMLGTLIPAFFLVELLGFQRTLLVASSLNGILALLVFSLSFRRTAPPEKEPPRPVASTPAKLYGFPVASTYWLLFLTGLCSMALEVVWIRLYTVHLGNVVYSFAIILAIYLSATCVGSVLYRIWVRSHDPAQSADIWSFLGLLALLPLLFADPFLPAPRGLSGTFFRVAGGIVPLSAALGFLTPLLVDHFSGGDPNRAGRAYAVNTVGSILGPLVCGFLVLPLLGDHWGPVALSIPLFGIGLLIAVRKASDSPTGTMFGSRTIFASLVLLSLVLVSITKGYETLLIGRVELRDHTATVLAVGKGMDKRLLVNGVGMTVLTPLTKYMAHLPLAFIEGRPQNGLVICFGMGTTFRSMLSWGIHSTSVELIPSVPKLFGFFHPDGPELLKSPLARIVVDDGRRFLERSAEVYDVITLDPPPPLSAPTTSLLFSSEFYEIVKKHLRPRGILHVWLVRGDPGSDLTAQAAIAKALGDSFPHVRAFRSLNDFGFHLLASTTPLPSWDALELTSHLPPMARADLVEWGPYSSAEEMFEKILEQELPLSEIASVKPGVPAIQDDRPINEYFFIRRVFGVNP